ncbi:hypothetical protein V2G26_018078 [Clonostachys chloroleuca]
MGSETKRTVRWGLMATGRIAATFARDLLVDPKTRGVSDVNHIITGVASSSSLESAQRFVAKNMQDSQLGVSCATYGSYKELVTDPNVDIIYIATPHSLHFENCMLALNAKKAVLCEKPLTVNAKQAKRLYEVAAEKKVFFMEAVWTRFFPLSVRVRELIQSGEIGDVNRVFVNNSIGSNLDSMDLTHRYLNMDLAGGALLDIGVYPLTWLFQTLYHTQCKGAKTPKPPTDISTLVEKHEITGADRTISMMMRFHMPNNSGFDYAHGIASASFDLPDVDDAGGPTIHIYGREGEIQVWGPVHRAQSIKVIPAKDSTKAYTEEYPIPAEGHGMFWEADEAARRLLAGDLQSETIPWDESVLLLATVDEIRKQAEISYPAKIETTEYVG